VKSKHSFPSVLRLVNSRSTFPRGFVGVRRIVLLVSAGRRKKDHGSFELVDLWFRHSVVRNVEEPQRAGCIAHIGDELAHGTIRGVAQNSVHVGACAASHEGADINDWDLARVHRGSSARLLVTMQTPE